MKKNQHAEISCNIIPISTICLKSTIVITIVKILEIITTKSGINRDFLFSRIMSNSSFILLILNSYNFRSFKLVTIKYSSYLNLLVFFNSRICRISPVRFNSKNAPVNQYLFFLFIQRREKYSH